jgi:2-oxo-4-hydroxy-4-carboxy-5-ureidoimidazoline decarboxylase
VVERVPVAALGMMGRAAFVRHLGAVFEDAPWVAEAAWSAAPFADLGALHDAMVAAVRDAGRERRLALIRTHPDLAGSRPLSTALAEVAKIARLRLAELVA